MLPAMFGNRAYLSDIKNFYNGSIVAYKAGHYNDNEVAKETIKAALKANPVITPFLHSDRGSQYTMNKQKVNT